MSLEQKYIDHVEKCFEKAERLESKISDDIKNMEGMTGLKTRHFYNNLLSMEDARHLEIGCWKGSSSCSAMFDNKATVTIIENWSAFGSPKEEGLANVEKFKGDNDVTFIEQDCFKVGLSILKNKFNIFLADADHSEESQYRIVDYYLSCMDDLFILIVDDVNWKTVRDGTQRAIIKNNLQIIWSKEIRLTNDDSHTPPQEAKETWHNGISVFILKKQNNG